MSCERPITIRNPRYGNEQSEQYWREYFWETYQIKDLPNEYINVPCGTCASCIKRKANDWRLRLMAEYNRYPNSMFITLTFDDDNLKRFQYNPNRSVRLFLDRARKVFSKSLRHFIIAERGEKSGRLHYHGILFNYPKELDVEVLRRLWKYGFVFIGYCNPKTINYVVKYITKNGSTVVKKDIPRVIVSKGLGSNFADYVKQEFNQMSPIIQSNGYTISLPRYIVDKVYSLDEQILMSLSYGCLPFEKYINGKRYTFEPLYWRDLKKFAQQQVDRGISPPPQVKPVYDALKPISSADVRYIEPLSLARFSPEERAVYDSCFEIENTPF